MLNHLTPETLWIIVGFVGQSLFFMRFFVQWMASEKAGDSIVPHTFWYFSIGGGIALFAYAVYRQDPVFMLGQSTGLLIYMRNIYLIRRKSAETVTA